jgi:hypothetical protein
MPEFVNQYDAVAATAILNGAMGVSERANAAYDKANPRPSEPAAFAQWLQNRNINRKIQNLTYLDQQSAIYNRNNPGGMGSLDAKGNFIRDTSSPMNKFILPGGEFYDMQEMDRKATLARLGITEPSITARASFGITPPNVYGWNPSIPKPKREGPLERLAARMKAYWGGK